ncbi:MAG: PD40 domain-containing protein [Candidatus Eisenbacteria bacterium]|nr:PD40 domain-containing protein [Candidatus Eisenbacteria bacterium]
MAGHLRRSGRVLAAFVAFLIIAAGCGDDDDSPIFDCPNCGDWDKIVDANASYPSYRPGSDRDVIAYSTDRGNALNIEHIWICDRTDGDAPVFYQITSGSSDDFDPMWSPSGDRISFTRSTGFGYELYLVLIDDFSNPGDEIRLTNTNVADTVTVSRPAASSWLDDDTILYSDGQNIMTITLDGDEPVSFRKVVNDPSDFVLSGTEDFVENQPTGFRSGSTDQIYFVSDTRVPLGAIAVSAYDEDSGEPLDAEIFLEGFPTGATTPDTLGGRPEGGYRVGVGITDPEATETYCDTIFSDLINVFENTVSPLEFQFNNPRGRIILLAKPLLAKFYWDGEQRTSIQTDTTIIDCVYPGVLHEVKIVAIEARDEFGNFLRDSIWVSVDERQDSIVVLDVTGQTGKSAPASGTCRVIHPCKEDWNTPNSSGKTAQWIKTLWRYDTSTGAYRTISQEGETPTHPAVDPTGQYLAYVVDGNSLKIVSTTEENQEWWIPLPGATGINICYREVAHPSWSADGSHIVVSMSPCTDQPSSDHNAGQFEIWEVRVDKYLD